ncbi:inverse autotransporter beta domain-containing protein [Ensifer adhaerens]|uniref:inverse autotransporter beta domain-containing protein n=1 Tax=Ensifer adhaerens TaxID=106592 RepID=UPI001CBD22D4|nr:inverse autotransporter beta domain-containing protein [Ensifer adhaerens]MBZ7920865.1 inverse autotransporter beta domain-containing protein [Ensifer adhaerens]UAX93317.1 inverse autotransporter beta domain-containing protein [Ensifer adhaerens]UAY00954.1 inverse autotransporter beta domain-containing protein [Ensifer adhaerens]UAY08335.1 inverse autotransporter beta domain-containing protein [Ensifer adhaerens]
MKNNNIFIAALASSTLLSSPSLAVDFRPQAEIEGGFFSGGSGASGGFFLPFVLDSGNAIFIDTRGTIANDSVRQGSIGAGYRFRANDQWIIGAYGYYDYLKSSNGNSFSQLSFGMEALSGDLEMRSNFYLPLTDAKTLNAFNTAYVRDHVLVVQEGKERARRGIDAEIGGRLPVFEGDSKVQLKVFGGSYWYGGRNLDDMFGAKLRAELTFADLPGLSEGSTVSLGVTGTYDNEDKLKGAVMARLRIPFGATGSANDAFDPMTQRVERTVGIRTHAGATGDIEAAQFADSGRDAGRVVTVSSASGDADAINALIGSAGTNALILADGDFGLDRTLALRNGQTLLGGGGALAVRGARSGATATFVNQGAATTITGYNPAQDVIAMASGSTISSLTVHGGLAGISATDAANLTVDNVDISATNHDGIRFARVDGALVQDSRIHDLFICENNTSCEFSVYNPNKAPFAAISSVGSRDVTVRDTAIDKVTYGVFAGGEFEKISRTEYELVTGTENVTLDNVTINNSRREGVLLVAGKDVKLDRVTIDNSKQDRDMDLVVLQGTSNVAINDMRLMGGINGLMLISSPNLDATTTNVNVKGLKVDGTRNASIFFNPVSGISLTDVAITNAGTYGAYIYGSDYAFLGGPVSNIVLNNMTVDKAGKAGLYFSGPAEDIKGNVSVTNTPKDCLLDNGWSAGTITQPPGSVLTVNGTKLDQGNAATRCR